jgi:hypothetical protein
LGGKNFFCDFGRAGDKEFGMTQGVGHFVDTLPVNFSPLT